MAGSCRNALMIALPAVLVAWLLAPLTLARAQDQSGQPALAPPPPPPPPPGGFGGGLGGGRFGGGRGGRGFQPVVLDPAQLTELKKGFVAPAQTPEPADNPSTPEKVALGEKLFFDPGLSANGKLACASCHDARRSFTDGEQLSLGVKGERLARHTPTVINLAWSEAFFWDGRASTMEQQAVMPIAEAREMGMPHEVMVSKLQADADYRQMFQRAFPGESLSTATVGKAIAAFERTLVFAQSPFDRWVAGDDTAISDAAKRGFVDFNTRAGCAQCHSGWNFSDGKFHDIGVNSEDVGRFAVVPDEAVRHWFKTPGLRNIAERAPYMHTGQLSSLQQVLRFYNRGFGFQRRATLSPEMRNVRARGGQDIIAFLQTLTTPVAPELVRMQEELERKTKLDEKHAAAK
ncbi:MAG: tryptophan tryptophylquinone biosynthesis enzyme MauG [Alphaproteobacteria bacterium]|nr:tryptophan tryptophylquinone biosynthesis enzyme MauG [Alphaproteobacteria bacterium]